MSAALGLAQMGRLEELLGRREQVAEWYNQRLSNLAGLIEIPQLAPETSRVSWFVYVIRVASGINRNRAAQMLDDQGIPARPYFIPIHLQPYMVDRFGFRLGDFPITEDLGSRGLALPFSGVMSEAQVDEVCLVLSDVVRKLHSLSPE
jgi:dTDP-4-amino-4,6-dideoxygalactose transaminase